jgi:ribose transport system permease protein
MGKENIVKTKQNKETSSMQAENGFSKKMKSISSGIWSMQESGIIIVTILYMVFVWLVNPVFLSILNLNSIFRQSGFVLISSIGMTIVFIAGGLDLSVGSVQALGAVVAGIIMVTFGLPIWVGIILGILAGTLVGLTNGYIIIKFKIPSIIMTLGTMYAARGIVFIITKGLTIYPMPVRFQALEQRPILGFLPTVVPFCFVLCVIFHIILTRTTFGRSIYAIGGNRDTAKLSGINIDKVTLLVYSICGALAALTGIVISSRLGSAQPSAGDGYEMIVIVACIIGGTSMYGGRGTILGTAIGAIFMSVLSNSMTILKVDIYYQKFFIGVVLILAVILDQYKIGLAQNRALKR